MGADADYALDRVGARVLIVGRYVGEIEATITHVGRKWSTASAGDWQVWRFDKTTGVGKSERDGFSASFAAWTPEGKAAHERRSELEQRLRSATSSHSWLRDLTVDQLEAILAIIDPGVTP